MQLDPMVMPDATPDWVAHVMERGLAHAGDAGIDAVTLEVDRADDVLRAVLVGHGFAIAERRASSRRGWPPTLDRRSARCPRAIGCRPAWRRCPVRIT